MQAFLAEQVEPEIDPYIHSKDNRSAATKLLLIEGFLSEVTLSLFDATSVVALFLSTLGAAPWQIGLVSAVRLMGIHVPQLFVATRFHGRLSGLLVKFASFQWLATVLMVLAPGVAHFIGPGPALACFALGWACFFFSEGASDVPWSEAVACTVGRKCGKFLGMYGLIESLGTMFAGVIVYIFARTGAMGSALGYLGVFGLGSLGLMATVPMLRRVERYERLARFRRRRRRLLQARAAGTRAPAAGIADAGAAGGGVPDAREAYDGPESAAAAGGIAADSGRAAGAGDVSGVVANAGDSNGAGAASDAGRTILQAHGIAGALRLFARKVAKPGSRFRPFVGAHLLSMGIYLISPFIFLYAWNEMGLTARDSGLVVCAEMAGLLLGSIAAGRLGERSGSGAVVRLSCIASAGVPLFAMLSGFLPATSLLPATSRAVWGLAAVTASMVCMGVFQASSWAGGTGYVVERTNEQDRPIVIAMLNFLVLPFLCLSPVGGLAIKQAGYIPVFAAAVVPCLGSAVLALKVD